MSNYNNDRLLWLTVAVGLAVACLYIPATLERVRTLTEVHDDKDDVKQLSHDAEAALKPEVLRVLADGPSYELRASAIKIVSTRALKDDAKKILLRDLASKDADRRLKAIDAISMMMFTRLMPADLSMAAVIETLCDLDGFKAIIDALLNCLPLHDIPPDPDHLRKPTQVPLRGSRPPSPLLPPNRPADEKRLMAILAEVLNYYIMLVYGKESAHLQAGIVTRWLNQYPFPCAQAANSHLGFCRSDVVSLFTSDRWAEDDPAMAKIMRLLTSYPEASRELRACRLKASSSREDINGTCATSGGGRGGNDWSEFLNRDILMLNGDDTAGVRTISTTHLVQSPEGIGPIEGSSLLDNRPGSSWARHAPERSAEEDILRRRRREAIVMAETGAPVTRENILLRQDSRVGLAPLSEPAQELLRVFTEDVAGPLRRGTVEGERGLDGQTLEDEGGGQAG